MPVGINVGGQNSGLSSYSIYNSNKDLRNESLRRNELIDSILLHEEDEKKNKSMHSDRSRLALQQNVQIPQLNHNHSQKHVSPIIKQMPIMTMNFVPQAASPMLCSNKLDGLEKLGMFRSNEISELEDEDREHNPYLKGSKELTKVNHSNVEAMVSEDHASNDMASLVAPMSPVSNSEEIEHIDQDESQDCDEDEDSQAESEMKDFKIDKELVFKNYERLHQQCIDDSSSSEDQDRSSDEDDDRGKEIVIEESDDLEQEEGQDRHNNKPSRSGPK